MQEYAQLDMQVKIALASLEATKHKRVQAVATGEAAQVCITMSLFISIVIAYSSTTLLCFRRRRRQGARSSRPSVRTCS